MSQIFTLCCLTGKHIKLLCSLLYNGWVVARTIQISSDVCVSSEPCYYVHGPSSREHVQ